MSIYPSLYHFYGIRLTDGTDMDPLHEDPGHCMNNGEVGFLRAGAYDQYKPYLALRWEKKNAGEVVFHSGVSATAPKFQRDHWNSDLLAAADRLGLETVGEPGWYTLWHED